MIPSNHHTSYLLVHGINLTEFNSIALVFRCFLSTLDLIVVVSAVVHAAPIVGAAV